MTEIEPQHNETAAELLILDWLKDQRDQEWRVISIEFNAEGLNPMWEAVCAPVLDDPNIESANLTLSDTMGYVATYEVNQK